MRILFLSTWFPYPPDNGSRIRVYHLLRMLAQRHQVTLLTLDPQGWAPAHIEAVAPFCERVVVVPEDPFRRGRLRTTTRFFSLRPVVATPFSAMTDLVRQLHIEQPFDAAIANTVITAAYALTLSGIPHILEEHNSFTRWMHERYLTQTSFLQRLRCWMSWRKSMLYEARLFSQFDLVTMTSEQDVETSRRLPSTGLPPVALVPNGVDCERFRPGLADPQPNTLIFNGALAYYANYDAIQFFLHQVYPQIRRQCPDAKLLITGSTKGVDLSDLSVNNSVIFTGFVEDIRSVVAAAWMAVVPILSGGGTRIKILEAMALGTPVVATSKAAEGLTVRDGEHILLADDPATFADCTLRLLRDPFLRRRLVTNARRLVEQHYDWAQICQYFVDLVEDITSRRVFRDLL